MTIDTRREQTAEQIYQQAKATADAAWEDLYAQTSTTGRLTALRKAVDAENAAAKAARAVADADTTHRAAGDLLWLVLLTEQVYAEAGWTPVGDLAIDGPIVGDAGPGTITELLASGEGEKTFVKVGYRTADDTHHHLLLGEGVLAQTGLVRTDIGGTADVVGAGETEKAAWAKVAIAVTRTDRAAALRELAALPEFGHRVGDDLAGDLTALADLEEHLASGGLPPSGDDLIARRRLIASTQAVGAGVVVLVVLWAAHGVGRGVLMTVWAVFLAVMVAAWFGLHPLGRFGGRWTR
jgi:hypothetical protein